MTLPLVTLLFAALHALLMLALLVPISRHRHASRISLGDGGDPALLRKIRVHANFVENVPLALVMLGLLELSGLGRSWIAALGAALLVGRLLHAASFSRRPGNSFGRFWGTAITWGVLLAMAVSGAWLAGGALLATGGA
ncbi:MAPEG family protein [Lysobacter psychrotolerans]|uniref:MAPEG family protein n=1 Tax=Montanilutibacter psychrotolerans TaxID=1327343 RepID=A0A3M8SY65_9GAMM|nr:MAPEG family protein [Lysobacter psychrotolerans]